MLRSAILFGMALTLIFETACTVKGSGSQRARYDSQTSGADSGDATADDSSFEDDELSTDEEISETCLKLQDKRKKNLKLLEDGEEEIPETEEEAACPTEDVPTDDEEIPAE